MAEIVYLGSSIGLPIKPANLQPKSIIFTQNTSTQLQPDEGFDGFYAVGINVNVNGIDMQHRKNWNGWQFTNEQFDSLKCYNWEKLTDATQLFNENKLLTKVPTSINLNIVDNFSFHNSFNNCTALTEINDMGFSGPVQMIGTFRGCTSLETTPVITLKNTKSLTRTFVNCTNLTYCGFYFDIKEQIPYTELFSGCSKLKTVSHFDFTGNLGGLRTRGIFAGCVALENIGTIVNLNFDLDLDESPLLTIDSLMNVINGLVDNTGKDAKTLTLGATNLAKLTDEQKAIATNKNWVLA